MSFNRDFPLAVDLVPTVKITDLLVAFGALLFLGGAVSLLLLLGSFRPERRRQVTLPAALPASEERVRPEWQRLDHERLPPQGRNRQRPPDTLPTDTVKPQRVANPVRKHRADP